MVAAVVLVVLAAGCSAEDREQPVRDVASSFYAAVASGDGAEACALLATAVRSEVAQSAGKPCPQAILEEQLPTPRGDADVTVYDNAGRVDHDGETAFLSEFPEGWRIAAVGCTPRDARPYDCTVSGG